MVREERNELLADQPVSAENPHISSSYFSLCVL
jgi:hypothetical protein